MSTVHPATNNCCDYALWREVQVHLKKNYILKKVNIFCHSFQKVKTIYYIDSLHRVKYFKSLFLEILMIMAYR